MASSSGRGAVIVKNPAEIEIMAEANSIVSGALTLLKEVVRPGITTWELDRIAEEYCIRRKGRPAFKGYRGFPGSLCVSVNEEVVHGIPSRKRKLKKGDILSIDFGVEFKGFFGDSALTVAVGKVKPEIAFLLKVTEESLYRGIEQVVAGNHISDISQAVQNHVEGHGFSVVKQFVGHGIGSSLHEPPEIPNFYQGERTERLRIGMVLAIEPMVNLGTGKVKVLKDGWTVVTADHKPSAHFEHSVAVTENGPRILS
ncbi:type I methionyl aminopeptidase [Desulfomarina profundi]|uniref:Methionine aminopeptidase n=1 Tax=Desulfomarina profundi TaxID=2772557 RepID=A0A8D5JQ95_9BACT|nr:type I methionyl aminopeptidase [Desulfomarina profundi]BCL59796.1 type I methionyl aminopeptidase [Desulfomarina profundi]